MFQVLGPPAVYDVIPSVNNFEVLDDGSIVYSRPREDIEEQTSVELKVIVNWFEELKERAPRTED